MPLLWNFYLYCALPNSRSMYIGVFWNVSRTFYKFVLLYVYRIYNKDRKCTSYLKQKSWRLAQNSTIPRNLGILYREKIFVFVKSFYIQWSICNDHCLNLISLADHTSMPVSWKLLVIPIWHRQNWTTKSYIGLGHTKRVGKQNWTKFSEESPEVCQQTLFF